MKETLIKKVKNNEIDDTIQTMATFDWNLISKDINGYKTVLTFEREKDTPYYQEVISLEKKWKKETSFPSWPNYLLVLVSFILITIYLVFLLNSKDDEGKLLFNITHFLSFMLPGLIFLLLAVLYTIIRGRKIRYIIENYYEKRREYQLLINSLKENK